MIMQIKRNILGMDVVIDLTEGEILDAHYEAERYNTREMLNERLMQEENIIDKIPPELFRQMVDEVMQEMDAMDENMGGNIFPAMNAVIEKHKDELKKEDMKNFKVTITETYKASFLVEAETAEEAQRLFWEKKDTDMEMERDVNDELLNGFEGSETEVSEEISEFDLEYLPMYTNEYLRR